MKKEIWKRVLLVNSILWLIAAGYFVYATTLVVTAWDWHRFLVALLVVILLTVSEVAIAFIGD